MNGFQMVYFVAIPFLAAASASCGRKQKVRSDAELRRAKWRRPFWGAYEG